MTSRSSVPAFDFAVSFAGCDRAVAQQLADLLSRGGATVFIDTLYQAQLAGKRLDWEFEWVFGRGTKYAVPIVSSTYAERPWPQHEWSVAQKEAGRRSEELILPVRIDDSMLFGLPTTVGYIDLREYSVEGAAALLRRRADERARLI